MTDINARYLYNITSGKTIGRRACEVRPNAEWSEELIYNKERKCMQWIKTTVADDGAEYSSECVRDDYYTKDNTYYSLLQSAFVAGEKKNDIWYGTVEDLAFSQIVELFLNGDLIVSELERGLKSKGATSIQVSENNGMTTVTFDMNDQKYTLKCATDAAASQVDDIKNTQTEDSISVTGEKSHYNNFKWNVPYCGTSFPEYEGVAIPCKDLPDGIPRGYIFYYHDEIDMLFFKYFGHGVMDKEEKAKLTQEEIDFVNDHPDMFPGYFNNDGGFVLTWEGKEAYFYEQGCYPDSADDLYSYYVGIFASYFGEESEYPECYVELDGNNIEYTDKSIELIQKYLSQQTDKNPTGYMRAFGFSVNDDEATIREKVSKFLKKAGSKDGKTLSLEQYYNAVSTNVKHSEASDYIKKAEWPTYNECEKAYGTLMKEVTQGKKILDNMRNSVPENVSNNINTVSAANGEIVVYHSYPRRWADQPEGTSSLNDSDNCVLAKFTNGSPSGDDENELVTIYIWDAKNSEYIERTLPNGWDSDNYAAGHFVEYGGEWNLDGLPLENEYIEKDLMILYYAHKLDFLPTNIDGIFVDRKVPQGSRAIGNWLYKFDEKTRQFVRASVTQDMIDAGSIYATGKKSNSYEKTDSTANSSTNGAEYTYDVNKGVVRLANNYEVKVYDTEPAAQPAGTTATSVKGIYYKDNLRGEITVYLWDAAKNEYVEDTLSYSGIEERSTCLKALNQEVWSFKGDERVTVPGITHDNQRLFLALCYGYHKTSVDGYYEKDGVTYKTDYKGYKSRDILFPNRSYCPETICSKFFEKATIPCPVENYYASNDVFEYTPMGVGGITVTEEDIQKSASKVDQATIDDFKNKILKYQNYEYFGDKSIPVFSVEIDENDNVVVGNQFKEALKTYLLKSVYAAKSSIASHRESIAYNQSQGISAGSGFRGYAQDEFLQMFGLSEIPYDDSNNYQVMYDWCDEIESIATDDSKLESLLAKFCSTIGSTDGKTTTLENYYKALADNNVVAREGGALEYFQAKTETQSDKQAKITAYLEKLKEKYPEVYDDYASRIATLGGCPLYSDGMIHCGNYVDLAGHGDDTYTANPFLREVLVLTAGIEDSDSYGTKAKKMHDLFLEMGATEGRFGIDLSDLSDLEITDVMNYLLGDNPERVNYFDEYHKSIEDYFRTLGSIELEYGVQDDSVAVEKYDNVQLNKYGDGGYRDESSMEIITANEIGDYIKNLLDPIYSKYFEDPSGNQCFTYFDNGATPECFDPDSREYCHITNHWKNESDKNAFTQEVEKVIKQVKEKYSDVLTSLVFDGQNILFSTIYNDEIPSIGYNGDIMKFGGVTGSTSWELDSAYYSSYAGLFYRVQGYTCYYGDVGFFPVFMFEPAVDNPINYLSAPNVYENNIPEKAPNEINGKNLVKTAWDGILVSEDGQTLYLWDSKNQKYIAVEDNNFTGDPHTLAAGLYPEDFPFGYISTEVDLILLSLVYGYNRTDVPYIFEKDGKYYSIDNTTSWQRDGFQGFAERLLEIDYKSTGTNSSAKPVTTTTTAPATTTTTTPAATTTTAPAPAATTTTPAPTTTTAPTAMTSAAPASTEVEEVSIKSKDAIEEMQEAAKKLGLTAARTTGIYYQFTANGSYIYIWNPMTKKFKAFSINAKNADGSINQEFTQAGRAVQRTEALIYYEAILEVYKNGYNFTVNYPWVCEKDGVYYEYDKEAGCFKKK